jgi:formate hydrogenlyase subunit 3/multisubunit Na+/H+ antiporter MnhD subunit
MWLHLISGTAFLLIFTQVPLLATFISMVVGSFCLGIVIYGFLAREYGLLINVGSYLSSVGRLFSSGDLSTVFLVVAIIIALVSAYFLLSGEYRRYNRDVYGDQGAGIPLWITVIMGTVVILLCIFGLNML